MINFFNKKTPKNNINQFNIIIKKGDICIDAGANVGNITAQMIDYGAKVYAFEPNPFAFAKLEQRFILNKNVVCYNKGVYSRQDKIPELNQSTDLLKKRIKQMGIKNIDLNWV